TSCISVHGANRLGGNSLLETIVFGRYVGRAILKKNKQKKLTASDVKKAESNVFKSIENLFSSWSENTGRKPVEIRNAMKNTMDVNVGVYREATRLKQAVEDLQQVQKDFKTMHIETHERKFNFGLIRALELRSMVDIAEVTAVAALWRKESRGAHFRTDYPTRDDKQFMVHSLVTRKKDELVIDTKPVTLGLFEVKERAY
ncbi:MAG: succinate dehydrogenase/fumarate reductase flavoprotein subunit, partial [Candidatus Heimdallarchaeota archaeon]|nr:succinate dehydrogenase/fumarate reductase flavoprotein subunit [Candidatus Heimdallarchaeota archaeon]